MDGMLEEREMLQAVWASRPEACGPGVVVFLNVFFCCCFFWLQGMFYFWMVFDGFVVDFC